MTRISPARLAGLCYLVVVLTGMFSLAYVPAALALSGSPAERAAAMAAGQGLYRMGLVSLLANQLAFLLLPLALWRVLQCHGRQAAVLMVLFAVVSVPLALSALGLRLDALNLALAGELGAAGAALQASSNRMLLTMTFWGLWLAPLGLLVWRSRIAPRLLAILLMAGCAGYLLQVADEMLNMGMAASGAAKWVSLPASLGEVGFCLWLVLTGGRYPRWWPGRPQTA